MTSIGLKEKIQLALCCQELSDVGQIVLSYYAIKYVIQNREIHFDITINNKKMVKIIMRGIVSYFLRLQMIFVGNKMSRKKIFGGFSSLIWNNLIKDWIRNMEFRFREGLMNTKKSSYYSDLKSLIRNSWNFIVHNQDWTWSLLELRRFWCVIKEFEVTAIWIRWARVLALIP